MFGKRGVQTYPAQQMQTAASPEPASTERAPPPAPGEPPPRTKERLPQKKSRTPSVQDSSHARRRVAAASDKDVSRGSRSPAIRVEEFDISPVDHSTQYYRTKSDIFSALMETIDLSQLAKIDQEAAREEIRDIISEIISIKNVILTGREQETMLEDICNDILGFGPLEPLLERDDISDIMVNGANDVYIEVEGRIRRTNIRFQDNNQLMSICQRIVSQVGRRVDESTPVCDARLLDGSRVNVIGPPLALDGPTLTIRKFAKERLTFDELVEFGSVNKAGAEILRVVSACRCNVLISGGTGSGKTTLLNCLTSFISSDERIVTCEDAAELQLQQSHVVRLETRPPNLEDQGQITMRDLVRNCLRMRPDRIVVGEVRGAETLDLVQAMNTGHDGTMGTVHANSTREALTRMESMIAMSGFNLSPSSVREMIVDAVDVVVQVARMRDGRRRIISISEIVGMEGDVVITQDILRFSQEGEDQHGMIVGRHLGTGVARPHFWEKARQYSLERDLAVALEGLETGS